MEDRLCGCESKRSHGVTVSTLDSESSDRGSNPREAFLKLAVSSVRKKQEGCCGIGMESVLRTHVLLLLFEFARSNGHTGI